MFISKQTHLHHHNIVSFNNGALIQSFMSKCFTIFMKKKQEKYINLFF